MKEYNTLGRGCVAIMLDTKGPEVRSGDLAEPIDLLPGAPLGIFTDPSKEVSARRLH